MSTALGHAAAARPRHLRLLRGGLAAALLILANGGKAHADPAPTRAQAAAAAIPESYRSFIAEAAQRFNIPAVWITSVIHVESGGNARAVSPQGAMGLMQIMPATWSDLRRRYQLGADPFDPHGNILAGAAYLRALRDRFGTAGFLAAYNAGPARYEAYRTAGRPLHDETRLYLAKLAGLLPDLSIDPGLTVAAMPEAWRLSRLFVGDAPATQSQSAKTTDDLVSHTPSVGATISAMAAVMALAPHADGLFVAVGPGAAP